MVSVSSDVIELVQVLSQEGYAILAGELLTEIGLGREAHLFDPDLGPDSHLIQSLGWPESEVNRLPLSLHEQMDFALTFLELRLISPILALAEAEKIAGKLAASKDQVHQVGKEGEYGGPIHVSFRSPPGQSGIEIKRSEDPGSTAWAVELSKALSSFRDET